MTQPKLIADRDNDNALWSSWDENTATLAVNAEPRLGAVNIWLRFRLENLMPGSTLHLDVQEIDRIAGFVPLYLSWDDGKTWTRTTESEPPFAIEVQGPALEVSRNLPYPHRRLEEWHQEYSGRQNKENVARLEVLCQSPEGRDVYVVLTEPPAADCPLIWLHARAHAFESHSSRVAEALIDWLNSEEAQSLRRRAMVCVIPMIDVDAVAIGSAGKNRSPHDPNRDYVQEIYPQTRAIKHRLGELIKQHPLQVFIDLHSPWYYNRCQWYVAPDEREHLAPLTDGFTAKLQQIGGENSWHDDLFDYTRYKGPSNPQLQASTRWAREQWPQAIVTTMEIAHNCDADDRSITPQGLKDYARALGLTLELCLDAVAARE